MMSYFKVKLGFKKSDSPCQKDTIKRDKIGKNKSKALKKFDINYGQPLKVD